jgi:hypothetical protein
MDYCATTANSLRRNVARTIPIWLIVCAGLALLHALRVPHGFYLQTPSTRTELLCRPEAVYLGYVTGPYHWWKFGYTRGGNQNWDYYTRMGTEVVRLPGMRLVTATFFPLALVFRWWLVFLFLLAWLTIALWRSRTREVMPSPPRAWIGGITLWSAVLYTSIVFTDYFLLPRDVIPDYAHAIEVIAFALVLYMFVLTRVERPGRGRAARAGFLLALIAWVTSLLMPKLIS